MKSLLSSTAVYLLLPLTAFAADLPYRASDPVAPVAATTWTGFYFGANAGVAIDRFSFNGTKVTGVSSVPTGTAYSRTLPQPLGPRSPLFTKEPQRLKVA